VGGLYRIDELLEVLAAAGEPQAGRRRPRYNLMAAMKWFRAGGAARRINAQLTMKEIDPATIERTPRATHEDASVVMP
jgi:hypothetical protein